MRLATIAFAAILIALAGDLALAQTAAGAGKAANRAVLRQDSDACAKQVERHRMDLFAECMTKRQAERKAAAKQKAAECGKEADAQNLHYVKRLRFIRRCKASGQT